MCDPVNGCGAGPRELWIFDDHFVQTAALPFDRSLDGGYGAVEGLVIDAQHRILVLAAPQAGNAAGIPDSHFAARWFDATVRSHR